MAMKLALLLLGKSIEPIAKEYRLEFFMREVLWMIVKRMRMLLFIATTSYIVLIYVVNIRNSFLLPEADNMLVLKMHIILLLANAATLGLVWYRRAKAPQEVGIYHFSVIAVVYVSWILATMFFIVTVIKTAGHPIFIFLAVLTWSSSLLFPPRVLVFTHIIFVGSLWTVMAIFALPTDNPRFTGEAFVSSLGISIILIVSGVILFKTTIEEFRQRKMVEEERNIVVRLNLETEALNQELLHRQDILEQQATEIEIINTQLQEQNQTLLAMNDEKTELMGIVAHDLKNPIGAVRSLAELVQSGFVEPEQVPEITEKIVGTADRMLELVTNLLDINRLEEGRMMFHLVEFDIMPLLANTLEQYEQSAKDKNITLHYSPQASSYLVFADEQATMQVLDNILSNAIKYSPHGKNVFVQVRSHWSLGIGHSANDGDSNNASMTNSPITNDQSTNAFLRIEVRDEGPGLSPDDMTKLFGKFARLSARPTGGEHSTGLGLSIVKKMVEAMNGKVWCESEQGKGATFIVELPTLPTNI
jgi:signal transduction histidine kinase